MLLSRKGGKAYFNNKLISFLKSKKYHEIICMFDTTNPCDLVDLYGKTLLHLSVEYGNVAIMEHLIALGANVDAQDKQGVTPLMIAIKKGRVKSIVSLLKANANIYISDVNGKRQLLSFIFRFAVKMPLDIVKMFFEKVKIENSTDFRMITNELIRLNCPLYCVALLRNTSIFKYMLDRGSTITVGCVYTGNTVLHVAVQFSIVDIVKLLIERGVDVNMMNKSSETALMVYPASRNTNENLEILKILLSQGTCLTACSAHGRMQIYNVLKYGTRNVIREVLQYMTDLTAKDTFGQTTLHYLMENENTEIIDELKGKKFDVNALDTFGKSALHLAAERAIVRNVEYLLSIGANVNICRGGDNVTPLFSALSSISVLNPNVPLDNANKCIELLLRHGADIQFVTNQERTIFDLIFEHRVSNDIAKSELFQRMYAVKVIIGHLALSESRGTTTVTKLTLTKINSSKCMRNYFNFCRQNLQQMKKLIAPSLSVIFFKCLADSEENVMRLARDRKLALKLLRAIKQFPTKTNYFNKLRNSLVKSLRITKLKKEAIPNLCKIKYLSNNQVVIDKIISYMSEQDLRILNQI